MKTLLKNTLYLLLVFLSLSSKAEWTPCPQGNIAGIKSIWAGQYYIVGTTDKQIYWANVTEDTKWQAYMPSAADDTLLKNCKYYKTLNFFNENVVWIWAKNEKNKRHLIIKIDFTYSQLKWEYISDAGDDILDITMDANNYFLYAVGKNGLFIQHFQTYKKMSYPVKTDLTNVVAAEGNSLLVAGNGFVSKVVVSDTLAVTESKYPNEMFVTLHANDKRFLAGSDKGLMQVDANGVLLKRLETDGYSFVPTSGVFFQQSLVLTSNNGLFATNFPDNNYKYLLPEIGSASYQFTQLAVNNQPNSYTIWGITASGQILLNNYYSLQLKPYALINSKVYCAGETSGFTPVYFSGYTYKWTIDGATTTDNYSKFYTFRNLGSYPIRLIVSNDFHSDTAHATIIIEDRPSSSLQISVLDSILCKKETTSISLASSLSDKSYTLVNLSGTPFGTQLGTGKPAILQTNAIDNSDQFKIKIQSVNSHCYALSDTTFGIRVEETKASFYCDEINPVVGEEVHYYNTSEEATSYLWKFGTSASPATLNEKDGITQYGNSGSKTATLIAISPAQCVDSLVQKGAEVLASMPERECWDLYMQSPANSRDVSVPYLSDMNLLDSTNMLICGYQGYHTLFSNFGDHYTFTLPGGYLANYSPNGTIKWIVKGEGAFISLAKDKEKNIYLNHVVADDLTVQYRGGKKIVTKVSDEAHTQLYYGQRVSKMDKNGKFLFGIQVNGGYPEKIAVDKNQNIFLCGSVNHIVGEDSVVFMSEKDTLTLFKRISLYRHVTKYYVIKTDPSGRYLWSIFIDMDYTNSSGLRSINVDNEGALYILGDYEFQADFYSSNQPEQPVSIPRSSSYGTKIFIMKYNASGEFQWNMEARTDIYNCNVNALAIGEDNSIYLTGGNAISRSSDFMYFTKGGTVVASGSIGGYYLVKLSKDGNLKWLVGSKYNFYGAGNALTIDKAKIAVSLSLSDSNLGAGVTTLSSKDGNDKDLSYDYSKYYIAYYDTSGNLKGLDMADRAPSSFISSGPIAMAFGNNNSFYYATTSIGNPNYFQGYKYVPFCSEVDPINNNGIWGKIRPNYSFITTGLENAEVSAKGQSSILYPNPSTGLFQLKLQDTNILNVAIYDSQGQSVANIPFPSVNALYDLNNYQLPSGVYKVFVNTEDRSFSQNVFFLK